MRASRKRRAPSPDEPAHEPFALREAPAGDASDHASSLRPRSQRRAALNAAAAVHQHDSSGDDAPTQNAGSDDEDLGEGAEKKTRFVWTTDLHSRFEDAVQQLGVAQAKPQAIRTLMGCQTEEEPPTRQNIKSHLQKYRILVNKQQSQRHGHPPPPASYHHHRNNKSNGNHHHNPSRGGGGSSSSSAAASMHSRGGSSNGGSEMGDDYSSSMRRGASANRLASSSSAHPSHRGHPGLHNQHNQNGLYPSSSYGRGQGHQQHGQHGQQQQQQQYGQQYGLGLGQEQQQQHGVSGGLAHEQYEPLRQQQHIGLLGQLELQAKLHETMLEQRRTQASLAWRMSHHSDGVHPALDDAQLHRLAQHVLLQRLMLQHLYSMLHATTADLSRELATGGGPATGGAAGHGHASGGVGGGGLSSLPQPSALNGASQQAAQQAAALIQNGHGLNSLGLSGLGGGLGGGLTGGLGGGLGHRQGVNPLMGGASFGNSGFGGAFGGGGLPISLGGLGGNGGGTTRRSTDDSPQYGGPDSTASDEQRDDPHDELNSHHHQLHNDVNADVNAALGISDGAGGIGDADGIHEALLSYVDEDGVVGDFGDADGLQIGETPLQDDAMGADMVADSMAASASHQASIDVA